MAASELAQKACVPCKGGVAALSGEELTSLEAELGAGWKVVDEHHLEKEFKLDGYSPAVVFTNVVARIAERQDHHPDILLSWGKVKITVWTHTIDGLTESDFVFAAKVEESFQH